MTGIKRWEKQFYGLQEKERAFTPAQSVKNLSPPCGLWQQMVLTGRRPGIAFP